MLLAEERSPIPSLPKNGANRRASKKGSGEQAKAEHHCYINRAPSFISLAADTANLTPTSQHSAHSCHAQDDTFKKVATHVAPLPSSLEKTRVFTRVMEQEGEETNLDKASEEENDTCCVADAVAGEPAKDF